MASDLDVLRDRLRAELPQQVAIERVELEHRGSHAKLAGLALESEERKKDHMYRMIIALIDDEVSFFVHIHGVSHDLTTKGTHRYSKACANVDEVLSIVRACWIGDKPS